VIAAAANEGLQVLEALPVLYCEPGNMRRHAEEEPADDHDGMDPMSGSARSNAKFRWPIYAMC
jgi:hypothetical protein